MAVCSTTALRKYLTLHSNIGQPLREGAIGTTRGHAEGETSTASGPYCRSLFKPTLTPLCGTMVWADVWNEPASGPIGASYLNRANKTGGRVMMVNFKLKLRQYSKPSSISLQCDPVLLQVVYGIQCLISEPLTECFRRYSLFRCLDSFIDIFMQAR